MRLLYRTASIGSLIFVLGCGPRIDPNLNSNDSTILNPEMYAKLLKIMPGAEMIPTPEFRQYQQQKRLKILTVSELYKDSLIAGAQLGFDAVTLTEFVEDNPEQENLIRNKISFERQNSHSISHQFMDQYGKPQTVLLMDNEFRLQTIAATLRSNTEFTQVTASSPGLAEIEPAQCKKGDQSFGPSLLENWNWTLKPYTSCIRQQFSRGTCSAFATISATESAVAAKYGKWTSLSPQALYNYGKMFWQAGGNFQEGFTSQTFFEKSLKEDYRFPFQDTWTYNPSHSRIGKNQSFARSCVDYKEYCSDTSHQGKLVCIQNSTESFECGFLTQVSDLSVGVKITDYEQVWNFKKPDESLKLAANYLNTGYPIVLEFLATSDFFGLKNGFVQAPAQEKSEVLGGHAVHLVGHITYDQLRALSSVPGEVLNNENENYFIAKNSWGSSWGDSGYALFSESYLRKYSLSILAIKDVDLRESQDLAELSNLPSSIPIDIESNTPSTLLSTLKDER